MVRVLARAPTRIDLGGGTLDIRPLAYLLDHRTTVNMGISLYTSAVVEIAPKGEAFTIESEDLGLTLSGSFDELKKQKELPLIGELLGAVWAPELPALRIKTSSQSPAGAGLGGSSSLAVSVTGALHRLKMECTGQSNLDDHALVRLVQDVEARVISCPTGCQDYWGALRGGTNLIFQSFGDPEVTTLNSEITRWLRERLVICFSGVSRASGINNWNIFRSAFDGDRDLIERLNQIGQYAEQMAQAIEAQNWKSVIQASKSEWELRKVLWPAIETKETKAIDQAANNAGADLVRICGAGGGGVMAAICEPEVRSQVCRAIELVGGQVLEATPADKGLVVQVEK